MARIITFDKEEVLKAAMLLFWQKGYADTSMQDIEKTMKLNRPSIYNTFGNKRDLFLQALNHYLRIEVSKVIFQLENTTTTSARVAIRNALFEVINIIYNTENPGGCLVVLSLLESHQHDKETKKILDDVLIQIRDAVSARLKQGEENHEFNHPIDHQETAIRFVALEMGMCVMAKANFPKKDLERLVDLTVQSIFGQDLTLETSENEKTNHKFI